MTGKTHLICTEAAVLAYGVLHIHGIEIMDYKMATEVVFICAGIGALLPDIDIPQSRMGSKFKFLAGFLKHRGITHTLVVPAILLLFVNFMHTPNFAFMVVVVFSLLVMRLCGWKKALTVFAIMLLEFIMTPTAGASILFGLTVGWVLHIFEDMFNAKGCPIFYPITKRHYAFPITVKTRHWSEYVFMAVWLGGCGLWALFQTGGILKILS